jgi:hypothetical protein
MRITALIIGLFTSIASLAQFSIEAKLDTAEILVGEQTHLRLIADGVNNPTAIEWPDFRATLPSEIELIETSAAKRISGTEDRYELSLLITSWDSGYYAIAPIPIRYLGEASETEALLFTVNNVQIDLQEGPKSIKDIYEEPFNLLDWLQNNWTLVILALLGLALIYLLIRLSKRKHISVPKEKVVITLLPHEQALKELEKLESKKSFREKNKKPFYSELTRILRAYLEDRFFVPAPEQTTEETLQSLTYLSLDQEWQDHFKSMLRTADRVKFAKERTNDTIAEQLLVRSKEFVLATQPIPKSEVDE